MSVNYCICGNLAFFKLIGVVLLNIYGIFLYVSQGIILRLKIGDYMPLNYVLVTTVGRLGDTVTDQMEPVE